MSQPRRPHRDNHFLYIAFSKVIKGNIDIQVLADSVKVRMISFYRLFSDAICCL